MQVETKGSGFAPLCVSTSNLSLASDGEQSPCPHGSRLKFSRPPEKRRAGSKKSLTPRSPRLQGITVQIPDSPTKGFIPLPPENSYAFPPDIIPPWRASSGASYFATNNGGGGADGSDKDAKGHGRSLSNVSTGSLHGVNLQAANEQAEKERSRYAIHSVLCESIFGQVVAATDLSCSQPVAIKLSNMQKLRHLYQQQTYNSSQDVLENPLHEAQIMKILSHTVNGKGRQQHPHVLSLRSEFHTDAGNVHWLVLEYAPNRDLFEMVVKATHFKENIARHYFLQILDGLNYIHEHNICHLDLSLENILLDAKWNVKICDFGVARPLAANGAKFPPMRIRSKLRYMAPEILANQPFEGKSADLFSLGVILYCMLVGHPPFESASPSDMVYAMISDGRIRDVLRLLKLDDRVSDSAADLLTGLVCGFDRRFTLRDILNHPWLQLNNVTTVAQSPSAPQSMAVASSPAASDIVSMET